jgi:hypothetical protein
MKKQKIENDGIISRIMAPDGVTHVKIVRPEDFMMMENNSMEIHYCTIFGYTIQISNKAPYSHVNVHYVK